MYGEKTCVWPGCPPQAILMCPNLVMSAAVVNREQAAHNALASCSSWSSRSRDGCKQRLEQLSVARTWHQEWLNFTSAALSLSLNGATLCLAYQQCTQ